MNFVNAEIAKIAVNSFVTTKITYANMIAGICQRTTDADVDVVTQAVGLDSRIGRKYLVHLTGEYLQNDANSFGYSYDQFRLSAILGLKLGRPWLLRLAAMRQFKNYREDIAPIIQRTLDPESDESNFLVADLSYNYTPKLTYLIRLAYYKNEAAQRGRFYRKTQLFIGGEFRF